MRLLRLLSRVAFICNICFLLASFIQWLPNPPEGALVSLIILLGYLLAIVVNTVINIWVIGILFLGKWRAGLVPVWIAIINFAFFAIQLTLLLINRK